MTDFSKRGPVNRAEIDELIEQRQALCRRYKSHRPLNPKYELIGLMGELAFSQAFGIPMKPEDPKGRGDKGIDFTAAGGTTIDVKCYVNATVLNCEVGKEHQAADVFVLASFDEATETATLIGWEYGEVLVQCEVREYSKNNPRHFDSHVKSASLLRPMAELKTLIGGDPPDNDHWCRWGRHWWDNPKDAVDCSVCKEAGYV